MNLSLKSIGMPMKIRTGVMEWMWTAAVLIRKEKIPEMMLDWMALVPMI